MPQCRNRTAPGLTRITPTAPITVTAHGGRAKCLQRLMRLELPVPETVALSFAAVHAIAQGQPPDSARILEVFGPAPLVSVRPKFAGSPTGAAPARS